MRETKLQSVISGAMALMLCAMAFFAASSGPLKSLAAERNNTEEVLEIEHAKYVSQSSHSRKLKPRQIPQKFEVPLVDEAPLAIPEFIEASLSYWLQPPNLLRAPPATLQESAI